MKYDYESFSRLILLWKAQGKLYVQRFFHSPVHAEHHRLVGCGEGVNGGTMKRWPPWRQHLSLELSISLAKSRDSSVKEEAIVANSHYKPQEGAENLLQALSRCLQKEQSSLCVLSRCLRQGYFQIRGRGVLSEQIALVSSGQ